MNNEPATPKAKTENSTPFSPPWLSPSLYPAAPADDTHGFMEGRTQRTSRTLESLAWMIHEDTLRAIELVWIPGTGTMVSPLDVPALFDAVVARTMAYYRLTRKWGLRIAIWSFFGGLVVVQQEWGALPIFLAVAVLWVGIVTLAQALWGLRRLRTYSPADMANEGLITRFWRWTSTFKCPWTNALIACIGVVFVVQYLVGLENSVLYVGLVKQAVWQGELWRLLTGTLVHAGVLHVGLNLLALNWLGRLVEGLAGRAYLAVVFLVAALTGSLFSLLLLPAKTSVGASGGIVGLLGFLIVLAYTQRHLLPAGVLRSLITNVIYIAVFGVLAFNVIDNPAHLGGLIAGLVLGALWTGNPASVLPLEPSAKIKIGGYIAGGIILLAAALTILLMVL